MLGAIRRRTARATAAGVFCLITSLTACSADSTASSAKRDDAGSQPSASATAEPQDHWLGRADVSVFLCTANDPRKSGCADGAVTDGQREEIRRFLEASPDVAKVFYESAEEAYAAFSRTHPSQKDDIEPEQMPTSFRVKLADPARFSDDVASLAGRPGVSMVIPVDRR
jgi:hypothetical protein